MRSFMLSCCHQPRWRHCARHTEGASTGCSPRSRLRYVMRPSSPASIRWSWGRGRYDRSLILVRLPRMAGKPRAIVFSREFKARTTAISSFVSEFRQFSVDRLMTPRGQGHWLVGSARSLPKAWPATSSQLIILRSPHHPSKLARAFVVRGRPARARLRPEFATEGFASGLVHRLSPGVDD